MFIKNFNTILHGSVVMAGGHVLIKPWPKIYGCGRSIMLYAWHLL